MGKQRIVVRRASKEDRPAILDLIRAYPEQLEQTKLPPWRNFFVAEWQGQVIACAAVARIVELRSVAVTPIHRGKKTRFADALVNACLDLAELADFRTAVLSTDSPDFFARFGFEIKRGSRTAMYLDLENGRRRRP